MFLLGSIPLDRRFVSVVPTSTVGDAADAIQQNRYIVVQADQSFVISEEEFTGLSRDSAKLIIDIIQELNIPPSSVCPADKLLHSSQVDWSRPVLVVSDEKNVEGVVTVQEFVSFLLKERNWLAAYLSTMAETVNDAVTVVNKDGRVVCWNKVAELTYGIRKEQIIGQKLGDYFDTESLILYRILDEGRPVWQEYHQPTKDKHVLINAAPIMENHEIIGGIATEHDITQIFRLNDELYSMPLWLEQNRPFESFVHVGTGLQTTRKLVQKVAATESPVLIVGEQGTEKELMAIEIHKTSSRNNGPFISVHCLAYPASVIETELFGFQGGAFTGDSSTGRPGKLELANYGTLLIHDIDEMPFDIQMKLLQYLETGECYRVGSAEPVRLRTRIIATAGPSLFKKREEGQFANALYYKLNVAQISIPPLRERTKDIPELLQFFLRQFSMKYKKPLPVLDPAVIKALMHYDWPGNLLELQQVAERLILLHENGAITLDDIPKEMLLSGGDDRRGASAQFSSRMGTNKKYEALLIEETLRKTYGNKSAAAKLLGISRATLYNKMKEYRLN